MPILPDIYQGPVLSQRPVPFRLTQEPMPGILVSIASHNAKNVIWENSKDWEMLWLWREKKKVKSNSQRRSALSQILLSSLHPVWILSMPNENAIVPKNRSGLDLVVGGSIPVIHFPWNRTHYRLWAYLSLLSKGLKFRGGNTQWAYFTPAQISRSSSAHDRSGVALCGVRSRNGTRLDTLDISLQGGFLMFVQSYGLIDRSNKAKKCTQEVERGGEGTRRKGCWII